MVQLSHPYMTTGKTIEMVVILLGKAKQTRQWTSELFSPETLTPFLWILSALFSLCVAYFLGW